MSKLQAHMALAAISQSHNNNNNHINNNKIKHAQRQVIGTSSHEFSPPSQIISNYANYESATRVPQWHHGFPIAAKNHHNKNSQHNAVDFHHHYHSLNNNNNNKPDAPQKIMPNVSPSIITPFIEQVQLKQKEAAAAAEQKNAYKQSHESSSIELNNGSYEVVNDVFSKHLVPPPPSPSSQSSQSSSSSSQKGENRKPSKNNNSPDKVKFNLSMKSPLQDASRFNYNNVISSTASSPSSTSTTHRPYLNDNNNSRFRPSASAAAPPYYPHENENAGNSGEKPNVFVNLNRSKDNAYKQHKLLHPSYTGGLRKKQHHQNQHQHQHHYQQSERNHENNNNHEIIKPFLPTPYRPEKEVEEIKIDYDAPQHSFFTIDDAVTPHFPESMKFTDHGSDELEIITLRPQIRPTKDYSLFNPSSPSPTSFTLPSTSTSVFNAPTSVESPVVSSSSPKPRQKLRRRKPKPHKNNQSTTTATTESVSEEQEPKPLRPRGSIKSNNFTSNAIASTASTTTTDSNELRTRNRLNHPNRVRRPNFTSPLATLSTADYDYPAKFTEDELSNRRNSEVTTTEGTTSAKSIESSSEQPEIRHRVRLRYKSKVNGKGNTFENSINSKVSDSQIQDTENVIVKQQTVDEIEANEFNIVTDNPYNEIKSSLKLPNLKLRNEAFTTIATTAETFSTSSSSSSIGPAEHDENNLTQQKIANNRPRFSIKELKRKQFLTSSTAAVSTTSLSSIPTLSSTTQKPDNQRFNRFRANINRRRNNNSGNETASIDSAEESEVPRKRYSSTRFSTASASTISSTESTPQLTTKRSVLPKRTFPVRNFTKQAANDNNNNNGNNDATITTSSKPFIKNSARPSTPSLRQRIQNYKKKETASNEVVGLEREDSIKNVNFNFDDATRPQEQHEQDAVVTSTLLSTPSTSTELPITRETSIMKIAKTPSASIKATTSSSNLVVAENTLLPSETTINEHVETGGDLVSSPSEHSQRVAELTIHGNDNSGFRSANIGQVSCFSFTN
jgi:hypothetical protein